MIEKQTQIRIARSIMDLSPTTDSSSFAIISSPGNHSQTLTLIPIFPHNIASKILLSLPYAHQSRLRSTSRAWNAFLSPASVAPLRRLLRLPPRHILCLFPADPYAVAPFLYDPAAAAWAQLPPFPCYRNRCGLSSFAAIAVGHHLYVLGGSHFDTRASPLNLPHRSARIYRFDLSAVSQPWTWLADMISPRASFAISPIANGIIVAGGSSQDDYFAYGGTGTSSVEVFDVRSGEMLAYDGFPGYRSGCVGFLRRRMDGDEGEDEFWLMGGHEDYSTVEGVVHYKNVLVLGLRSGKWREGGDMWEDGEREKLGQVVVVDGVYGEALEVFMLDRNDIFRFFIQFF